ncbi:type II secretion system F family protein [Georgenia yuyongxinii]|uniref:Type II secretion system protein F n=1 Tax=Georgenia yuyongxinii TaxID=2589797 RepID=A0A552WLK7_9MICO|nr:type II secretion system F family protein [Georgenia yuyongxinii]TRW43529.1 type II secretion system protein F [Georgenia yuyongxinii]
MTWGSAEAVLLATLLTLAVGLWAMSVVIDNALRTQQVVEVSGTLTRRPVAGLLVRVDGWIRRTRPGRRLQARLGGAGLSWSPARLVTTELLAMALAVAVLLPTLGRISTVVIVVAIPVAVSRWLDHRVLRRTDRFIAQLPELARLLANSAAAGLSIRRGLEMASREMSEPASSELVKVVGQLRLGRDLEYAMRDLATRLPSRELSVLVQTIVIQSRAGGALVTALSDIASSLEDRKELRREVGTVMLGSVFGGYAVVAIGVASVLLMNLFVPGILDVMASSPLGQLALAAAGGCFVVGFVLMKMMTKVEI